MYNWLIITTLVILILFYKPIKKILSGESVNSNSSKTPPDKTGEQNDPHALSTPATKKNKTGLVGGIIGLAIGVVLLVLFASWAYRSVSSLFEPKPIPAKQIHTTIHYVSTDGEWIYLHPGWKDFPDRPISIKTPGGEIIEDEPTPTVAVEPIGPYTKGEGFYQFASKGGIAKIKIEDTY